MRAWLGTALIAAALTGAPDAMGQDRAREPEARVVQTARLNAWLDAQYDAQLDFSPTTRTMNGGKKGQDKIDDMSPGGAARALAWQRRSVAELRAKFDRATLPPDARLSYDLWIYRYRDAAELARFSRNSYVFNQLQGPHTTMPQFLMQTHAVDTPADLAAYIARIGGIARAELQLLDVARRNAAAGSRVPRFAYVAMIPQARALIIGAPFGGVGDSPIWKDVSAKIERLERAGRISPRAANGYRQAARRALLDRFKPAYEQLIAWFSAELPKADAIATGVGKNPNGRAYYDAMLKSATTSDLTADQVHRIGLDEVARIRAEMEAIRRRVKFEGTLEAFFQHVRDDPKFYDPDTDAGRSAHLQAAAGYIAFIKARLPRYFGLLPKADVVVTRVEPYREIPGGAAHYLMASPDGSRPGTFYLHLSDMRARPRQQLEATTYHEALPGHHLNFSIASERTDIPEFRKFLYVNAYQEGWGLYAEKLGKEMGGYQDPYSDFGRLTLEIWRAVRLVVDTGLHAKGWTEEQAVQYFMANSAASEAQIRSEVQRYIVMPGQAAGYKIGMLQIETMRRRAESALGDRFDIRGFHDTILGRGQMPLRLLDQQVDAWIAARRATKTP